MADCEMAKLLASDGAVDDFFGYSVDVSGDMAIIGAYGDDDKGYRTGSAYIFRYNGSNWEQETKLTASDSAAGDFFGISVAISGDMAIIGAYGDSDKGADSGSAYIYRYNGSSWDQEAKLTASDGAAYDAFGCSVDISGDTLVIGAFCDSNLNGDLSGSAYVFRFNGSFWQEEAKLIAYDGEEFELFGVSVAISGDTAVIGAYYDDDNGDKSGSAYIFRFMGIWTCEDKLLASDGAGNDFFGYSVDISGDIAVIGTPQNDDNGTDSGSAYVFRFDGTNWIEETKLTASDGAVNDRFGISVATSGDTAVIGAHLDDDNGTDSGSAYVFRFDESSWIEETKQTASDGAVKDHLGLGVAISGETAVIGAWSDDDNGTDSGSSYVFALNMNPGDLDLDNDVDFVDYCLFASYWMESNCGPCDCNRADFTRNGSVDINDLRILCESWMRGMQ